MSSLMIFTKLVDKRPELLNNQTEFLVYALENNVDPIQIPGFVIAWGQASLVSEVLWNHKKTTVIF